MFEYYIIFALTTAIFALVDVFMPVLRAAQDSGVNNTLTENPKLSYFVYLCITTIVAPMVILPLLVPSMNARFRDGMAVVVNQQEKI